MLKKSIGFQFIYYSESLFLPETSSLFIMRIFFILVVIFNSFIVLKSQTETVTITADTSIGCGQLKVKFTSTNTLTPGFDPTFIWNINPKVNSDNIEFTFDTAGIYNVSLSVKNGFEPIKSNEIKIEVKPSLNAYFTKENTTNDLEFEFHSKDNSDSITYKWEFSEKPLKTGALLLKAENQDVKNIVKSFPEEGIYLCRLTLTNNIGCEAQYSDTIGVAAKLDAPNFFTPNGDGINDFFSIVTRTDHVYDFRVYNRAGVLIFKNESPTIHWDGTTVNGSPVMSGLYFYTIETKEGSVKEKLTGVVTIFK